MPILLTDAVTYPSSHGKPAEVYNELKAHEVRDRISKRTLELQVQYGNTVGGVWVGGKLPIATYLLKNIEGEEDGQGNVTQVADPQYDNYMATTFGTSAVDVLARIVAGTLDAADALAELEQLYQENATALYMWVQSQESNYAGTIQ